MRHTGRERLAHVVRVAAFAALLAGAGAGAAAFAHDEAGLDFFDEAAFRLTLHYGGISPLHPRELLGAERDTLRALCASAAGCPEEAGIAAVERVISALDDGHTSLIPPTAFAINRLILAGGGEAEFLGALVAAPGNGLGLVVLDVLAGSGAEAGGLVRGDRVLQIDGEYLPAHPERRLDAWFAAEDDDERTEVQLTLLRAGSAPLDVTLVKQPHELDRPPLLERVGEDVARIWVRSYLPFFEVAPRFFELLADAERFASGGLIVDLRTNGGGALSDCMLTASAFGEVAARVYSTVIEQTLTVEGGSFVVVDASGRRFPQGSVETFHWPHPVVVLVNATSASCAEVMAFEAQRLGVVVIGEETAGVHDTSTNFFALPSGWGLAVSVSTARDVDGARLPASVTPDVVVEDDLMSIAEGADALLLRALELLAEQRRVGP